MRMTTVLNKLLAVDTRCEQVIVSLNTSDPATYAQMMGTAERTYHRVVENLKNLLAIRGSRSRSRILVQFLFHRGNYRAVPDMYRLAREIGVDNILFNGLAYQPAAEPGPGSRFGPRFGWHLEGSRSRPARERGFES